MAPRLLLSIAVLALLAAAARAQSGEAQPVPAAASEAAPAAEGADLEEERIVSAAAAAAQARTLTPADVPAELQRLKSKADIKAEIVLKTTTGRPISFKGVIRNGKLIERILDRKFVPETAIDPVHSGVRLWWSGDSDGYIFFKYSAIQSLTITGRFTEAERRALMERLKRIKEGKQAAETPEAPTLADGDLDKMAPEELKAYLVRKYPYDKGWNHEKKQELTRRRILENKPLSAEEAAFEKYFAILAQARFEELQKRKTKIQIENPGADPNPSDSPVPVPVEPPPAPPRRALAEAPVPAAEPEAADDQDVQPGEGEPEPERPEDEGT
jgi:hypothetical protein